MRSAVTEHALNRAGVAGVTTAKRECDMQVDWVVSTAVMVGSYMALATPEAPPADALLKIMAICAGCGLGSLAASAMTERASLKARALRLVASFGSGAILTYAALWLFPPRDGVNPWEWAFVMAGLCSFLGWHLMKRLDSRAEKISDRLVDEAIEHAFGGALKKHDAHAKDDHRKDEQ